MATPQGGGGRVATPEEAKKYMDDMRDEARRQQLEENEQGSELNHDKRWEGYKQDNLDEIIKITKDIEKSIRIADKLIDLRRQKGLPVDDSVGEVKENSIEKEIRKLAEKIHEYEKNIRKYEKNIRKYEKKILNAEKEILRLKIELYEAELPKSALHVYASDHGEASSTDPELDSDDERIAERNKFQQYFNSLPDNPANAKLRGLILREIFWLNRSISPATSSTSSKYHLRF